MKTHLNDRLRAYIRTVALSAALISMGLMPARAHANSSWVESFACPAGVSIFVIEDDGALAAPRVVFGSAPSAMMEAGLIGSLPSGTGKQYVYWSDRTLPAGKKFNVTAFGARNESYGSFTVSNSCAPLGGVRGTAFNDLNANGVRDAGEPALPNMGWKITAGGNWFFCGVSGADGAIVTTVKPSTYTLIPVAAPGWVATSMPSVTLVRRIGDVYEGRDLGFKRAPEAAGGVCGLYSPTIPSASSAPATQKPSRVHKARA